MKEGNREMDKHDDRHIREALKQSFPPVNTELARDLWPSVLRRFDMRPVRIPWYDWVMISLSAGTFLLFPRLLLLFAYHI